MPIQSMKHGCTRSRAQGVRQGPLRRVHLGASKTEGGDNQCCSKLLLDWLKTAGAQIEKVSVGSFHGVVS
jgi:hypothetical protein